MPTEPITMHTGSIESLEAAHWPEPGDESSGLMHDVHAARRVPIDELTPGQLRLLLRQNVGTELIVHRAIEFVSDDPLLDAGYYPGDLLAALVDLGDPFWIEHPDEAAQVATARAGLGR